jgi:hypothetical protein
MRGTFSTRIKRLVSMLDKAFRSLQISHCWAPNARLIGAAAAKRSGTSRRQMHHENGLLTEGWARPGQPHGQPRCAVMQSLASSNSLRHRALSAAALTTDLRAHERSNLPRRSCTGVLLWAAVFVTWPYADDGHCGELAPRSLNRR